MVDVTVVPCQLRDRRTYSHECHINAFSIQMIISYKGAVFYLVDGLLRLIHDLALSRVVGLLEGAVPYVMVCKSCNGIGSAILNNGQRNARCGSGKL